MLLTAFSLSAYFRLSSTQAMQLFQVMRLGSVALTSILLAKSGLSTAAIGAYEMLLYLGSTVVFLGVNGLLQSMPAVYYRLDEAAQKVFIFNVFLVFGSIGAVLFALFTLGQIWVTPALTGLPEVPYFRLFCVYLLFNIPTLPVEILYLLREKAGHIAAWGAAVFGLHLVAVFAPIWLGYGLEGGLYGLVLLAAAKLLWTVGLVARYGQPVFSGAVWREYLGFSAPLVLNALVGNLVLLFDNWLVGWHYRDEAVFAVFRYGSREFPLALALATALGTAMVPRLVAGHAEGLSELKLKTRWLFHLLFPLTIALLFLSKPLFPLVFNPDFAAAAPLFNIYLLLTASRVLLPNSVVLAKGDSRAIFGVGILELMVKIATGFLFIQWWGLPGLAWSAVLSFWVEKIGLVFWLERRHNIRTTSWLDLWWYLAYTGALCAAFLLQRAFF